MLLRKYTEKRTVRIGVAVLLVVSFVAVGSAAAQTAITSAQGDTAAPGGQATVSVQAEDVGAIDITDIPNSWSVASSQNDGAFLSPDGSGDSISNSGDVTWAWSSDQSSVSVSVTFNIPSNAALQNNVLAVGIGSQSGDADSTTVDVTVQQASSVSITSVAGDTTSPGGQATVSVQANNAGGITISNAPTSWSVASSQNDGASVAPDGSGDNVASQGTVNWDWSSDQSSVSVSITFDVPSSATVQNNQLDVEAQDSSGNVDTASVNVDVQQSGGGGGGGGSLTGSPGGQVTVPVQANGVGGVTITNIPTSWSVDSSQNDGSFLGPDGQGDSVSSQGSVLWAWSSDRSSVDVSVTLNIPSTAQTGDYPLTVETEDSSGNTNTYTETVTVQNCSVNPVVCQFGDRSGNVNLAGLQNAIQAFINGSITLAGLQAIIQAFIAT